ncbi:hypothetical protein [Catelliglobosispora koreensis]|uniref:hypothetical protein n=1 Tax=Catelliglobosispora koreensis TaxID=129052 RepID=UPI00036A1C6B|nr:hypothetical protein [Catelliglobosispora koreensis]
MSRCTQTQALQRFAALGDADAGRLTGQCLYHNSSPIPPGTLREDAANLLHASVYRQPGEPVTGETLVYVVSSDGTPVAWLDYQARVHTPPAQLTSYQRAHQVQAVTALSRLTRDALGMLARLRDARDRRDHTGSQPTATGLDARVLVANSDDPTLTYWTRLNPDPAVTRRHVQTLTGSTEPIVVEVFGYGDYGRHRAVIDVEMLCAIEELAVTHGLTATAVGDWLYAEGAATATTLTPQQVKDEFTTAFAGIFDSRPAFARAERDRRGWTRLLDQAGIPRNLFDDQTFARLLFTSDFRDITLHDYRVAVLARAPQGATR